jgi:quercetin dioxygenase-like cupin family protein
MPAKKGLIIKAKEKPLITEIPGHSKIKAWEIIRPGENGSIHLRMLLNEFEPGGGIELHTHELVPVADHAYYVISGKIKAVIGDKEEIVGPDTLLYCLTDTLHSIENVGDGPAKLLRIGAAATGDSSGKSIFVKDKKSKT